MKILHVIHTFPPLSRAGSENYCEALAREQHGAGHSVAVFYRGADSAREEHSVERLDTHPFAVYRVNNTFREVDGFASTYRNEGIADAFDGVLGELAPDVVHFHHLTCLSTTCVHRVKARAIPVVFTLHDFWMFCGRGQLFRRDLTLCDRHDPADCARCMSYQLPIAGGSERVDALQARAGEVGRWPVPASLRRRIASWPFRREAAAMEEIRRREEHFLETCGLVDRFIAPSRFLADRHVEFGIPRERIVVSDYGFDTAAWGRPEPRMPREGPLRVVYLGTWIPTKGVHVLIAAARPLDPAEILVDLHGYAPGYDGVEDYETQLRELAADAPHVHFRGRYDPEALPGILAEADVVVVPSIWYENSPLTIHEAFLAGVPVVLSDHGGMAELVRPDVDGLSFRPGDAKSLRRVLRRLIADRGLAPRLAAEAPTVKTIAEDSRALLALYRELSADDTGG